MTHPDDIWEDEFLPTVELTSKIRVFDPNKWVEGFRWFDQPDDAQIVVYAVQGYRSDPYKPTTEAIKSVSESHPGAILVYL